MRICILSSFNPACLLDYYDDISKAKVINTNVVSSSVNALALGLLKLGHNVMVVTISESVEVLTILRGERVEVYVVPWGVSTWWRRYFVNVFIQIKRIRDILRYLIGTIDVIHAQWTYNYAVAALPFTLTKPTCCTVRDWNPYLRSLMITREKWSTFELLRLLFFRKVMNAEGMHFIANSSYTLKCLIDYKGKQAYPVIPNSVRGEFLLQNNRVVPQQKKIISIQQNVDEPRKNVLTLLDAFSLVIKSYPDVKLVLVGTYDVSGRVYNRAKDLHLLDSIEFSGKVSHLDIIDLIDDSLMLVHPAFEETFGNIFLEAMARKVPTIGGLKSGAVPQVLGNGKYGCLCDVNSGKALSEAIIRLLNDRKYADQIVYEAYDQLLNCYSEEAVAKQHEVYYNEIIGANM